MSRFQTVGDANARDATYHSVFARKDMTEKEFNNVGERISELKTDQKAGFERIENRLDTIIKMEMTK